MTKLCKDCIFCEPKLVGSGWFKEKTKDFRPAKCKQQPNRAEEVDLVTGEITPSTFWYCSTQRGSRKDADCGPEGKFWEPR